MIRSIDQIREEILDCDGSCRDLNFMSSDREAVAKLIGWFSENYEAIAAFDDEGRPIGIESIGEFLGNLPLTKSIQIGGESPNCIIKKIQVFLYIEDDASVSVEVTFFPQDIKLKLFEITSFLELMLFWQQTANAHISYLRYENASWKFGDTSKSGGVIYVSKNT
jgi:hypothetical protein